MAGKEVFEAIKADLMKVAQKSKRSYTIDQRSTFDILSRMLDALINDDPGPTPPTPTSEFTLGESKLDEGKLA